ncbi:MAG: leucyl aminopeptidase [Deltaproteobacteria bacterium]|jgi:leucyl aminopeptidase|nr:leucyl aminopeptidase [Deltaproteobacteria bacterium]MDP7316577.1 leucyl aminopeptidase [SAR324 cluster bacterium]MDP7462879.1 leucyl aminopeptidase [SAR324 cluster bacterium]MDP7630498.1 leucyl aminopeptidase [SAR324 cluster bacterium]
MDLKMDYSSKLLSDEKLDALVVFVSEDSDLRRNGLSNLPRALKKPLSSLMELGVFSGKKGTKHHLVTGDATWKQALLVGLGPVDKLDGEGLRRAAGKVGQNLSGLKADTVGVLVTPLLKKSGKLSLGTVLAEGIQLGAYEFKQYKSPDDDSPKKLAKLRVCDPRKLTDSKSVKVGTVLAEATNSARTLGNTPPNDLRPQQVAEHAQALAKRHKLKCKVLEEQDMQKLGMGMLLGVSQGSEEPAKLIILEYRPAGAKQTVALVGKGITFDSGGLSLKPGKGMEEMKYDMCGSAAVLGAMSAVAQLKPKVNVIGVVAASENMPSGTAQRPGDIVTAYNGKRVEVLNTDAEGRLVLGDALAYTVDKLKPDAIIDLATLTGACIVALGHYIAGAVTNNDELMGQVQGTAQRTGERVWQLPSDPEYGEAIKSNHGDLKNIADGGAGTIIGGVFLEHFVGDTPWVHLDIAGVAWGVKSIDYHPSNSATGFGVRLLLDLLQQWRPLKK